MTWQSSLSVVEAWWEWSWWPRWSGGPVWARASPTCTPARRHRAGQGAGARVGHGCKKKSKNGTETISTIVQMLLRFLYPLMVETNENADKIWSFCLKSLLEYTWWVISVITRLTITQQPLLQRRLTGDPLRPLASHNSSSRRRKHTHRNRG